MEFKLTTEQRLQIREFQLQMMSLKDQARQCSDRAVQIEQSIAKLVNAWAVSLGIDFSLYSFDLSTLDFTQKPESK